MGRRQSNRRGNKKRSSGRSGSGANNSLSYTSAGPWHRTTTDRSSDDDRSNYSGCSRCSECSLDSNASLPFAIGTRVELPHLKDYPGRNSSKGVKSKKESSASTTPHTGTITGHWKRQSHWPKGLKAPYMVLMDDGMALYSHRTDAEFLYETTVPAMVVTYNIGCRVECQLAENHETPNNTDPRWFPGTILQCHPDWSDSPIDTPPYFIRFDYGRERPFWGPADRIRELQRKDRGGNNKFPPLRFELGDRVKCSMDDDMMPGTIVKTWYREDEFENNHAVPYQVLLDSGEFIYAPMDNDDCIIKSNLPPPRLRFGVGDKVKCRVEGGWEPGIITSTEFREVGVNGGRMNPYEIKLDMGDLVYAPCDNDLYIRKILRFKVGDRVECYSNDDGWMLGEIAETEVEDDDLSIGQVMPYEVHLDSGDEMCIATDDDSCIKHSTAPHVCRGEHNGFIHVMSRMLIYNEEYNEAEDLLQERIEMIRSKLKNNVFHSDVSEWRIDLSYFLCYLAEVYQAREMLEEMKAALDEALSLTKLSCDKSKLHRLLNVTAKLANYSALKNDKRSALMYSEEAILFIKETTHGHDSFRLGLLLLQTGKLNIGSNNRQRGLNQMSDGIDILVRLYGSDNKHVLQATEDYVKIQCEGGAAMMTRL